MGTRPGTTWPGLGQCMNVGTVSRWDPQPPNRPCSSDPKTFGLDWTDTLALVVGKTSSQPLSGTERAGWWAWPSVLTVLQPGPPTPSPQPDGCPQPRRVPWGAAGPFLACPAGRLPHRPDQVPHQGDRKDPGCLALLPVHLLAPGHGGLGQDLTSSTLSCRCHLGPHATLLSGCLTHSGKRQLPPGEGLSGHRGQVPETLVLGPQAQRPPEQECTAQGLRWRLAPRSRQAAKQM